MVRLSFTRTALIVVACLGPVLVACRDELPTDVRPSAALAVQSAPNAGSAEIFHFLPPLRPQPAIPGPLDTSLLTRLAVEVCEWTGSACGGVVARFTSQGQGSEALRLQGEEHYHVNWHTGRSALSAAKRYRLRVLLDGAELGGAPLRVVDKGKKPGAGAADASEIVVHNGSTVPVKFWVSQERGPRLAGDPASPASTAMTRLRFDARPEDYSLGHPELPGLRLSHNTLLLVFQPATTVGEANAVLGQVGAADIVGAIPGDGDAPGILFLRLEGGTHERMEATLAQLRQSAAVLEAVQDVLLGAGAVPRPQTNGDPPGWTWETTPTGANWNLELIRAPQMWNLNAAVEKAMRASGGQHPITGILDVGFSGDHAELAYEQSDFLTPVMNHGTQVAGIIGAASDDGIGIDGVNRFARLYVQGESMWFNPDEVNDAEVSGGFMLARYHEFLTEHSGVRVLNLSLNFNWWATSPRITVAASAPARDLAYRHGALVHGVQVVVSRSRALPIVVASAGNDGGEQARYGSPFANAALDHNDANIIVVEAIEHDPSGPTAAKRPGFSNMLSHVSAPGKDIWSTVNTAGSDGYALDFGTSFAAPHVTGLVGYLYSLAPDLPNPTLTANPVRQLIVDAAAPFGVPNGRSRIDAFATVMGVDRVRGNTRVLKMLVDVDDGTRDGNLRTDAAGSYTGEDADADGGPGDDTVDMSDFRRWRDWLLQAEAAPGLMLDGSPAHPKKDLNGDGRVQGAAAENVYPRGDFNGDGVISRTAPPSAMPGAMGGTPATDLAVLEHLFADGHYDRSRLQALIESGDLDVDATVCLAKPGVARVRSTVVVRRTPGPPVEPARVHDRDTVAHVFTLPLNPAGYTAHVEGLDAAGVVVARDSAGFSIALGSDTRWRPECPMELVPYEAEGWQYSIGAFNHTPGFEQPDFDASGWAVGQAAFGSRRAGCPLDPTVKTTWPVNTDILLRRTITLPAGMQGITIGVAIDNDIQVFFNGTELTSGLQRSDNCAVRDKFVFAVPAALVRAGENVLAVRAHDRGAVSFVDVRATAR